MSSGYYLFFTLAVGLQAADASWNGTWKMDASKSHFENVPLLKSMMLLIRTEGENDVLEFSVVDSQGKPSKVRLTQPHKGGKVSAPPEPELYDDATVAVPDDHHWVYTYKKNGRTVAERHVTLSADGKSHEAKLTGKMPDGKTAIENEYMVRQ
jgi:hypothetical protein